MRVDAVGWPARSLEHVALFSSDMADVEYIYALEPYDLLYLLSGFGELPLRPLWPGFAINTIFYATFLWLLTCLAIAVRRSLRLRRGLCPKCAYPMGGSAVCTECGHKLPQRVRAAT